MTPTRGATSCCTDTPISQLYGRFAEAVDEVRIEGPREELLAEVLVVHRAAFAVGRRVQQIAVRDVVAVDHPIRRDRSTSASSGGSADQRIQIHVAVARRQRLHVLPDVELDAVLPLPNRS